MLEIVPDTFAPGVVVGGAYRLERIVGKGGMGVVWAAREIATGRAVALKFLHEPANADTRSRERFLREARAAMIVSHPHVARVESVLETETGAPFMVMELLEGRSLREVLRQRGPMNAQAAARILLPVVDAVAAAHEKGIVHRDLKPENVFLVNGEHVRVLDFGIAKRLVQGDETASASLTSTGALLGTPVYMAPEQLYGEEIDGRADVWSLGIMLYELVAGRRPTDGEGFGQIMKRITVEPLASLDEARPGLPRSLTRVVTRMLSRSREARPTLAEVRAVLVGLLEGTETESPDTAPLMPPIALEHVSPIVTTASPTALATTRPPDKLGFRVAMVAVVIAVGTLGFAGYTWSRLRKMQPVATTSAPAPAADAAAMDTSKWYEISLLASEAQNALLRRDGAACLTHLDRQDRLGEGNTFHLLSTDPRSGLSKVRAECMMLTGHCDDGRMLYRRHMEQYFDAGPNGHENEIDDIIARSCESDRLTPRDAVLRAGKRLDDVSVSQRNATAAECREWQAALRRFLPQVPARSEIDPVHAIKGRWEYQTFQCFARTGDCEEALRAYRASPRAAEDAAGVPAKDRDRVVRAAYDMSVMATPCAGRP